MRQWLLLALALGLGYLVARLLMAPRSPGRGRMPPTPTAAEEMVQDPACRTYIPRAQAIRRTLRGQEHCFCSPGCLEKFLAQRS
jgi:YHS domain-containing protein